MRAYVLYLQSCGFMKLFGMSKCIRSWHFSIVRDWNVLNGRQHSNKFGESVKHKYFYFLIMNYLIGTLMTRTFLRRRSRQTIQYQHLKCCDFVSFFFHYLLIKYDFHCVILITSCLQFLNEIKSQYMNDSSKGKKQDFKW